MKLLTIKNITWNTVKKIANLNFSIIMLLLIALISIIGTIIEQNQNLIYYQINYPIRNIFTIHLNWQIITFLGIDHIYSTWWFSSILILFFFSISICTFSRQLPSLKKARNWKFLQKISNIKNLLNITSFYQKSLCNVIYSLNYQNYYVFHKNNSIYAYKGLLGRIAPIFVHVSIILVLIGSITGLMGGFMAQEMIPCNEIFHINNIIKAGSKSHLPENLIGKIQDFSIEYHQNNSIKQFFSSIELIDNQGNNITKKRIAVNSPLIFQGTTFYQTDWQINSIRLKIGKSKTIQKKLNKVSLGNQNLWVCSFPVNSNEEILIIIKDLKEQILLYNFSGTLLTKINLNEKYQINNTYFSIQEIMTSTGLQIKTDPGIIIVYIGFFTLIVSTSISYLSYSQIWAKSIKNNLELAGSTNRASLSFEEDFTTIQEIYTKYTR
uniref:Cytochrome c biogenesis protein CcsB n=1 Tax=Sebdenia flabellata TaxID=42024 RepID=A0A1C9CA07_9FLOR|nr:c-type cytochrome biogenensis protein [Sebdenia flabellata]AOM65222.1 c-type cytochrome biogenensis protein [Sebdenia flabellata]